MSGDSRSLMERIRQQHDAAFAAAREEVVRVRAEATDKELFSIEGLERELNEFGETTLGFSAREVEQTEHSYYLLHVNIKTLARLAQAIALNYPWRPSVEELQRKLEERKRETPEKERFSVDKLLTALGDRRGLLEGLMPSELEWYEMSYYFHHPDISTVADFAATVTGALYRRR